MEKRPRKRNTAPQGRGREADQVATTTTQDTLGMVTRLLHHVVKFPDQPLPLELIDDLKGPLVTYLFIKGMISRGDAAESLRTEDASLNEALERGLSKLENAKGQNITLDQLLSEKRVTLRGRPRGSQQERQAQCEQIQSLILMEDKALSDAINTVLDNMPKSGRPSYQTMRHYYRKWEQSIDNPRLLGEMIDDLSPDNYMTETEKAIMAGIEAAEAEEPSEK